MARFVWQLNIFCSWYLPTEQLLADNDIFWRPLKHNKKKKILCLVTRFFWHFKHFLFLQTGSPYRHRRLQGGVQVKCEVWRHVKEQSLLLERARSSGWTWLESVSMWAAVAPILRHTASNLRCALCFWRGGSGLIAIKIQTTLLCNRIYLVWKLYCPPGGTGIWHDPAWYWRRLSRLWWHQTEIWRGIYS